MQVVAAFPGGWREEGLFFFKVEGRKLILLKWEGCSFLIWGEVCTFSRWGRIEYISVCGWEGRASQFRPKGN